MIPYQCIPTLGSQSGDGVVVVVMVMDVMAWLLLRIRVVCVHLESKQAQYVLF